MRVALYGTIFEVRAVVAGRDVRLELEDGSAFCCLSVVSGVEARSGWFWLKDWSENLPVVQALIAGGFLEFSGRTFRTGRVQSKEARLRA